MKPTLLLVVLLCLFPVSKAQSSPGSAFETDSNNLIRECKTAARGFDGMALSREEQADQLVCIGYIEGAVDAFVLGSSIADAPRFCVPQDVKVTELVKVFIKYVDNHPEQLHYAAAASVFNALVAAFPCKKR